MNRIKTTFDQLMQHNQKAHISYLTAGDPDVETSFELVKALIEGGSDIVEIGIPFSDPIADGPVIQAAATRALNKGITVDGVFVLAKKCREITEIPLLFLVYLNTILVYGKEKFLRKCQESGIDGLIVPDLPFEERDEIFPIMKERGIELIPLVAPTSRDRVSKITSECNGFVYCVSSLGVTGSASSFYHGIDAYIRAVREQTDLPIAIGFGINNHEDVKRIEEIADGVIVGTAIVREISQTNASTIKLKKFVHELYHGEVL